MAQIVAPKIELTEEQESRLLADVNAMLTDALGVHSKREEHLAGLLKAYKRVPEHTQKDFPWPGASNVVVPLVQIVVDAIVARLMKSVFGVKQQFEVEVKSPKWEPMEKDIRDWCEFFFSVSGSRDRLRGIFYDLALYGEAIVKPMWVEKKRIMHQYDDTGQMVENEVLDYEGPVWHTPAPADIIDPHGFDDWDTLPWVAERLRFTKGTLIRDAEDLGYEHIDEIIQHAKPREDVRYKTSAEVQHKDGETQNPDWPIVLYEIWGFLEIPIAYEGAEGPKDETKWCEVILTYNVEADVFVKKVYNPFFGRARFLRKIPYLVQAHEVHGLGAAEQALPFQIQASTVHNQIIDAATAANGGITVASPESNIGAGERVHPGKTIVDPNPEKVRILHLAEASSTLQNMLPQIIRLAETSTGVSAYHLGMESAIVGSQATATGTTALINEGNQRFWVSIDDMRDALVEVLYLTIQLVQQMSPEGVKISEDRTIVFPQGDVRSAIGLKLNMASEALNKDVELQNLQVLMAVLNEYYARLMNAAAMIFNPQFPQEQKSAAIQIMTSAHDIVKRFVERFSVENVDTIVPNILTVLQQAQAQGQQPGAQMPPGAQAPPNGVQNGQNPAAMPPAGPGGVPGGAAQPPQSAPYVQ
jgi:hypothetical protein